MSGPNPGQVRSARTGNIGTSNHRANLDVFLGQFLVNGVQHGQLHVEAQHGFPSPLVEPRLQNQISMDSLD